MSAPVLEHTTTAPPQPRTQTSGGSGDHEMLSHIVKEAGLTEAYFAGLQVEALCGKKWVPTRDPLRYDLCGTCKDLAEAAIGEPWLPEAV